MGRLLEWMSHRRKLLGLASFQELGAACGLPAQAMNGIAASGSLKGLGRSGRGLLARALKVSLRELERLDGGKLDWIPDDRVVDLSRLGAGYVRPALQAAAPHPSPAAAGNGVPVMGRIVEGGHAELFEEWTPQEGNRLPIRYPGVPDACALQIVAGDLPGRYEPGAFLVVQPLDPSELKEGEEALITCDGGMEGRTILCRIQADGKGHVQLTALAHPVLQRARIEDLLRAGRIIGIRKAEPRTGSRIERPEE